jgi:para-nitrobenzyl esterase
VSGGGFSTGSSNQLEYHDGRNLAATGEAVVVSVNHRLNVLGYLDLSEFGEQWADTGNLGQLDLVASLQWVRDNIASFGGDPNNVTLLGQSGGGGKILSLMGMPEAEGLFHKAWLASAAPGGRPTERAQAQTRALMDAARVSTPEELAALPYLSILAAGRTAGFSPSPVTGTAAYPEPTYTAEGGFVDQAADIPVVVTTTLGEFASNIAVMTSFIQDPADPLGDNYRPSVSDARVSELINERFGDRADEIVKTFRETYPGHDDFDVLWMETGRMFGGPRDQILSLKAEQGDAAVYGGVFAKNLPVFGGVTPGHTVGDVPFLLRNDNMMAHLTAGEEKEFARYADEVSSAVLSFAATGDPGTKKLEWPEYTADKETLMVFDDKSGARDHHEQKLYDLFAEAGS